MLLEKQRTDISVLVSHVTILKVQKKYEFGDLGSLYIEHWEIYGIRQKYSFVSMC